ncbi:XRE family transcriptional regulator [Mycolicibacterium lutetiense]|uniref:Zn-dependent peptidase ImmA (M78 family)/transcriptional regulator with XRE-family HTH domain n=1 Tax=Mycolicibacterium lutetiense TaxID=1641992 RepID=A0ABS4ZVE3_9MYCO|nr:XRE family transcriptional regulator [Mycolicibacterium lutetiense]MBP2453484.1 Zn-dependent peptidase ImmA (M78 family)/transcriptional regulator with XRE-family HTH domain [Mycolicibacterium lutetiense]
MSSADRGLRVAQLRRLLAITQKDLAEATGTASANLSNIENGRAPLTTEMANRIAAATATPVEFFDQPATGILTADEMNFRKNTKVSARGTAFVEQSFSEIVRIADRLRDAPLRVSTFALPILSADEPVPLGRIEQAAEDFRRAAGLSPGDPVRNVIRTAERAGIAVAPISAPVDETEKLLAGHNGVSSTRGDRAVLSYISGSTGDRQRFTVAHEIGHIVLHKNRAVAIKLREQEAHHFAGAMFLPRDVASREISETLSLHGFMRLKAQYGLSIQAAIARGRTLGLISQERQRSLMIQISSRGWRKSEPVDVRPENPMLLWSQLVATFGPTPYLPAAKALGVAPGFLHDWIPERNSKSRPSSSGETQSSDNVVTLTSRKR